MRPRRFDQAQELADKFKDGQSVILNLEAAERDVARRLIDFASGVCYSLDGSMEKVATGVYLLKPPPAPRPPIRRLRELRPMALSPQRIRDTNFKSARKGYDPAEVDAFVEEVAAALETAQNEATAMEARARAAVARLQELSQQAPTARRPRRRAAEVPAPPSTRPRRSAARCCSPSAPPTPRSPRPRPRPIGCSARPATTPAPTSTRPAPRPATLVEEAKAEARRAGESERVQVEGEVQALLARRDFLESDVDHLEQYLVAQRERLVEVVATLTDLVQRVPGGLADMRRPLLSAAAESPSAPERRRGRRRRSTTPWSVVEPDDERRPVDVDGPPTRSARRSPTITRIAEATRGHAGRRTPRRRARRRLFAEDGEPTAAARRRSTPGPLAGA